MRIYHQLFDINHLKSLKCTFQIISFLKSFFLQYIYFLFHNSKYNLQIVTVTKKANWLVLSICILHYIS